VEWFGSFGAHPVSSHNTATITAAAAVPHEVRANIQQLAGFAVAWPKIAAAVGLPAEVCRCVCGLSPTPKSESPAALPWSDGARQGVLFE
jgi:hypothetical protein